MALVLLFFFYLSCDFPFHSEMEILRICHGYSVHMAAALTSGFLLPHWNCGALDETSIQRVKEQELISA